MLKTAIIGSALAAQPGMSLSANAMAIPGKSCPGRTRTALDLSDRAVEFVYQPSSSNRSTLAESKELLAGSGHSTPFKAHLSSYIRIQWCDGHRTAYPFPRVRFTHPAAEQRRTIVWDRFRGELDRDRCKPSCAE